MNYRQTIQYLYDQLPVFHRIGPAAYKPDMGNIEALCQMLGQPHQKFRSIHIAGTNGKGSVSHLLASILQSAGYKTGLHTSPHLKDYRERFRINGKLMLKSEVIDFVKKWRNEFATLKPSFFEMSVALAFDHFSKHEVDIAVIETGMGGRLDSTNILLPEVSVITNIGWDHMMFLGDTLEKIAKEKAGIIKRGIPVVLGETLPETRKVFLDRACCKKAPLYFATENLSIEKTGQDKNSGSYYRINKNGELLFDHLNCPLGGDYQQHNILTVLKTVDVLNNKGYTISDQHIYQGISDVVKQTGLKGRWQVLGRKPLTIADIGHNKDGLAQVLSQIKSTPHEHLHFVLGMVNDKDIEGILAMLPKAATYYFCRPDIPRGLDAEVLAKKAKQAGLNGTNYNSVAQAYHEARKSAGRNDLVFVGGSTFVVAEII
jgi:dihydrofolate synthase / folylpolyglutamate synthase